MPHPTALPTFSRKKVQDQQALDFSILESYTAIESGRTTGTGWEIISDSSFIGESIKQYYLFD